MFVDLVFVPEALAPDRTERGQWPFTMPSVAQLLESADIIECGAEGFRRVRWEELELVDHWRRYLNNPAA
ncbi:hypothetical protein ACIOEX_02015 [Streptomyces sp. NPDC087850]|uniref:hypothetical protein n=1 Tax=unclassified Streptomyces TaxID=2593676 RepID=UPI00382A751D